MEQVKTNSFRAWWLASRPRTLSGAVVPVIVPLSLAAVHKGGLLWIPALLCLLFALIMQIDANLVNDYFDCVKGVDREDRLGPERACAQGWVTLPAMRRAIGFTTLLASLVGLPLVHWGGPEMVVVGIACVIFCFLYTTLLSRVGMGDVLVLLFFGIVPVCATYYIQTGELALEAVWLSLACGLVTDCLLIVNNYRDRETDEAAGKHTLVTLIGARATEWLYLLLGFAGTFLTGLVLREWNVLMITWLVVPHWDTWRKMKRISQGKALNGVLGLTARNILLFGLLLSVSLLLKSFF